MCIQHGVWQGSSPGTDEILAVPLCVERAMHAGPFAANFARMRLYLEWHGRWYPQQVLRWRAFPCGPSGTGAHVQVMDKQGWHTAWEDVRERVAAGRGNLDPTMFPPEGDPLPLEHCMRFLPHHQDTGGFFVAVLRKVRECADLEVPNMDHRGKKGRKGAKVCASPCLRIPVSSWWDMRSTPRLRGHVVHAWGSFTAAGCATPSVGIG